MSIAVLKDSQIWSERRVKIVWWRINKITALMKGAQCDITFLSVTRGHVVNNSKLFAAFKHTYSSRHSNISFFY